MRFLVDENLGNRFTNILNESGYDALFVGDIMRGALDEKILAFAENENRIIITDDKDFGELIFRLKLTSRGVILLRILTTDPEKIFEMVVAVLDKAEGKFIVVSEGHIRVREL